VYVCADATTISNVVPGCSNKIVFTHSEAVAGTESRFAQLMNQKVEEANEAVEKTDEIMEEIDDLLEDKETAEKFVKDYVQKGGE